jgi:hypothetical protein
LLSLFSLPVPDLAFIVDKSMAYLTSIVDVFAFLLLLAGWVIIRLNTAKAVRYLIEKCGAIYYADRPSMPLFDMWVLEPFTYGVCPRQSG